MNPFDFVQYESARLVSKRVAVLVVDLSKNSHLTDPSVVERGMSMYQSKYFAMEHWTAEASGGMLTITVEGDLSIPNNPFKE